MAQTSGNSIVNSGQNISLPPLVVATGSTVFNNSPVSTTSTGTVIPSSDTAATVFIGFSTGAGENPTTGIVGNGTATVLVQPIQGGVLGNNFMLVPYSTLPVVGSLVYFSNAAGNAPTVASSSTNSIVAGRVLAVYTGSTNCLVDLLIRA